MMSLTWNRLLHSRGRLALTVAAVAVGVAFLTAALLLAASTDATLRRSYAQVYAGTTAVVRGPAAAGAGPFLTGTGVPADLVADVATVDGVAAAEGVVRGAAQLAPVDRPDVAESAVAMATPLDPSLGGVELRSGRAPRAAGEVAVDAAGAARLGLGLGDRVALLLPTGETTGRVVGHVGFGDLDALAGGVRVLLDRDTAGIALGADRVAEVLVRARADADPAVLADRLRARVGGQAEVVTADEAALADAAAAAGETRAVSALLLAVAAVSVLVAGFLVANTFRMLAAQRAREVALLRAVGATRRQVGASVRLEAALTGAAGSLVGVVAGLGIGWVLVGTTAGFLPGVPSLAPTVTPLVLAAGPALGVGLAVVAAHGAVRRALAAPPIAALRDTAPADRPVARARVVAGAVAVVGGGVGVTLAGLVDAAWLVLGAAVVALVGVGALFPVLTGPVLHLVGRPLARLGVAADLAAHQARLAPRRVGATAAALAVALALVTFLLTFGGSLAGASADLVSGRQHAELTVRPTARQGLHEFLGGLTRSVDTWPGVAAARVVTYAPLTVLGGDGASGRDGVEVAVYGVDPAAAPLLFDVDERAGRLAAVGRDEVAVRAATAQVRGWRVGDVLDVAHADGTPGRLTVAATFEGAVTTDWIVAPSTIDPHLTLADRQAFVRLTNDADHDAVRGRLDDAVAGRPAEVLDIGQLGAEAAEANGGLFRLLAALFGLAALVAVLGVANTLALAMVERVRELGLLRAVGASRAQVRTMVRWEATLTAALGAGLGLALGLGGAWAAVRATPDLDLPFDPPVAALAVALAATVALGVVAAAVPARRAARVDVLRALRTG